MGVDIYGRKPKIVTERPEQIDYRSSSDEEKDEYWNKLMRWETENPGTYFRYNWWCWRPIHML
jgi:hypothetical protein